MNQHRHSDPKITAGSRETEAVAAEFATLVRVGETVALIGPLGAGKTTFTRGFVHALGFTGPVRSPSFTLANRYPSTPPVTHLDLFRLSDPSELIALDLDGEREQRILLVEWGDRFEEDWGPADWVIRLAPAAADPDKRTITITRQTETS